MLQPPFNNLIVKVKTKYIKNISNIMKMSSMQKESTLKPADCVNIVGEIVSLPKAIDGKRDHEGYSLKDIKVGDVALFSHLVIFSFIENGANAEPAHRNMFTYKGEEYFVCDIQHVYAVIRNGQVIMVNGYAMVYDFDEPKIFTPVSIKKQISVASSEVMHTGNPKENEPELWDVLPQDTVIFPPNKAIKYQLNEKPFRIVRQSHILAVTGQSE